MSNTESSFVASLAEVLVENHSPLADSNLLKPLNDIALSSHVALHRWLKDVLGAEPEKILLDDNPDHLRITVSVIPLMQAMGGQWKQIADKVTKAKGY